MISPIEIKKQEFRRTLRGYEPEEVRSFLETIADEMEQYAGKVRELEKETQRLTTEIETFQRMESHLKDTLVNAQETLKEAKEEANREALLKSQEAEVEAEQIIRQAYRQRENIMRDVEALLERKDAFVRKLRSLLQSELELIQILEADETQERKIDFNMHEEPLDLNIAKLAQQEKQPVEESDPEAEDVELQKSNDEEKLDQGELTDGGDGIPVDEKESAPDVSRESSADNEDEPRAEKE